MTLAQVPISEVLPWVAGLTIAVFILIPLSIYVTNRAAEYRADKEKNRLRRK